MARCRFEVLTETGSWVCDLDAHPEAPNKHYMRKELRMEPERYSEYDERDPIAVFWGFVFVALLLGASLSAAMGAWEIIK